MLVQCTVVPLSVTATVRDCDSLTLCNYLKAMLSITLFKLTIAMEAMVDMEVVMVAMVDIVPEEVMVWWRLQ